MFVDPKQNSRPLMGVVYARYPLAASFEWGEYHDIHSAVADNETWKKTTGSGLSFDRNGVTAKKNIKKGTLAIQVTKGRKQWIIKPVFQIMLPLVTIGFVVSVSRSSPVRWGKDHGVRDEADISPGRILQGLRKCFSWWWRSLWPFFFWKRRRNTCGHGRPACIQWGRCQHEENCPRWSGVPHPVPV